MRSPAFPTGRGFSDARIVRRRRKRNVQSAIIDFGTLAVRVDEQEGFAGGVPTWQSNELERKPRVSFLKDLKGCKGK